MRTTFPRLLLEHAQRRPQAPALREKEYGIWQTLTWAQLAELVKSLAAGLAAAGLRRGQHLVVVGENRPRLYASMLAAQSLGAPTWKSHLSTTLPLSVQGLLAAFLLSFTFAISAFVVPMILGKGRVQFLSNMIYNRFSEVANYPSGAAISLVTLVVCFATIYLVTRLVTARAQARGEG